MWRPHIVATVPSDVFKYRDVCLSGGFHQFLIKRCNGQSLSHGKIQICSQHPPVVFLNKQWEPFLNSLFLFLRPDRLYGTPKSCGRRRRSHSGFGALAPCSGVDIKCIRNTSFSTACRFSTYAQSCPGSFSPSKDQEMIPIQDREGHPRPLHFRS
jgi:hypothetical protein